MIDRRFVCVAALMLASSSWLACDDERRHPLVPPIRADGEVEEQTDPRPDRVRQEGIRPGPDTPDARPPIERPQNSRLDRERASRLALRPVDEPRAPATGRRSPT